MAVLPESPISTYPNSHDTQFSATVAVIVSACVLVSAILSAFLCLDGPNEKKKTKDDGKKKLNDKKNAKSDNKDKANKKKGPDKEKAADDDKKGKTKPEDKKLEPDLKATAEPASEMTMTGASSAIGKKKKKKKKNKSKTDISKAEDMSTVENIEQPQSEVENTENKRKKKKKKKDAEPDMPGVPHLPTEIKSIMGLDNLEFEPGTDPDELAELIGDPELAAIMKDINAQSQLDAKNVLKVYNQDDNTKIFEVTTTQYAEEDDDGLPTLPGPQMSKHDLNMIRAFMKDEV